MVTVVTNMLDGTLALGEALGRAVRGGEVLELLSDIGGGKTAFVKGLARGLDIQDVVQSPTFTLSRLYQARDGLELHHFDFYRLMEAGVMAAELAESLAQPNAIVAIEWGDIVHDILPKERATIVITALDATTRRFDIELPKSYGYLLRIIETYKNQEKLA